MAIIAVDFDNTIAREEWPFIGDLLPGARDVINKLHDQGHKIIIWTCREGEYAEEAIEFLEREGVKFDLFNNNCEDRMEKYGWDSRKIGCDISIDDRDIYWKINGIDWKVIDTMLTQYFDGQASNNLPRWREWRWEDLDSQPA